MKKKKQEKTWTGIENEETREIRSSAETLCKFTIFIQIIYSPAVEAEAEAEAWMEKHFRIIPLLYNFFLSSPKKEVK